MGFEKTANTALVCCGLLLAAGCATTKETPKPVFYPPKPAEPKLQYLTSFTIPDDLLPPPNAFHKFIFGADEKPKPALIKPYGLTTRGSKLYVCDTITAQIHILDFENRTWEYFRPKYAGGFSKAINIAVDSDDLRYVADPARGEVLIYDATGTFEGSIGKKERMKPVGVSVSDNRILIGDLNNHKVHVFDRTNRELLFSIPRNPDNEQEKLYSPTNVSTDPEGNIYVSDTGAFRVQQYAPDGTYTRTYGSHGTSSGTFARNKGIAVDREGRLFAVDAASQTVQIFDQEGNLLLYFGEPGGSPAPLVLPAGITIDYENIDYFQSYADSNFRLEYLVFVSNQYGSRKVAVYGFGAPVFQ
jgi:sugar lactone lactonase YvrE